jgi:ABC-type multidrug transport system fused ATPase/permease subunit
VSQDVALFSGTIQSNLDPHQEYTTEDCLDVVRRCHMDAVLRQRTENDSSILHIPVNQSSLSAGEKQLLALARAVLRRTNIIIMDEATSQIDNKLDEQVTLFLLASPFLQF